MNDLLAHQAKARPEAVAIDARDHDWTWQALDETVTYAAQRLAGTGIRSGATVAALLHDGPRLVATTHAATRAGMAIAPIHPHWTDKEIVDHLGVVQPDLVVCQAETEEQAALTVQGKPLITVDDSIGTRAVPMDTLPPAKGPLPGMEDDAIHSVISTSGTSGQPRAAELRLGAHLTLQAATQERLDLGPEDRWLHTLSMAHVGGMATAMRCLVTGATLVHRGNFSTLAFNTAADAGEITHASLVPTMLHQILDERAGKPLPDHLACLLIGGASAPRPLVERALDAGAPIALTYGQTETTSQIATAPPSLVARKPGTVGPPVDPVEVKINAPDADGQGEILVRGPTLLAGYRGPEAPAIDEDGWLATGDLGHVDEEGHLFVSGRKDDRIVTGGVTVDPAEVEDALMAHVDVRRAVVVGVEDAQWGQLVGAAVALYHDAEVDEASLKEACRDHLSSAKLPRRIVFVEGFPVNANDKVDKQAVRELLASRG